MESNPSGVSGIIGKIADAFDRLPVKGALAVVIVGVSSVVAFSHGGFKHGQCDTDPLIHVYNPKRLVIIEKCAEVTGTVMGWRKEHDGDVHVNMRMDSNDWTNAANDRGQHGLTVVEFVPLMKKPKFFAGQRLRLQVTKVYDQQHKRKTEEFGWIEGHPVFKFEDVTPYGVPPEAPNNPALAPPSEDE